MARAVIRNKNLFVLWISSLFLALFSGYGACLAQTVSSDDLIKDAAVYENKKISYIGEVIGEVMSRGKFAWINVNDGKNAIGIWLPGSLAKAVSYTGNYKTRGDTVEVTGTFNRACVEHGGDMDIHADNLEVISSGTMIPEKVGFNKSGAAVIFAFILGATWILNRLRRR